MKTMPVNEAAAYCIEYDILRSFLMKNRAEVVDVCIFEYNEELHLKTVKEEGIEEGIKIKDWQISGYYSRHAIE